MAKKRGRYSNTPFRIKILPIRSEGSYKMIKDNYRIQQGKNYRCKCGRRGILLGGIENEPAMCGKCLNVILNKKKHEKGI